MTSRAGDELTWHYPMVAAPSLARASSPESRRREAAPTPPSLASPAPQVVILDEEAPPPAAAKRKMIGNAPQSASKKIGKAPQSASCASHLLNVIRNPPHNWEEFELDGEAGVENAPSCGQSDMDVAACLSKQCSERGAAVLGTPAANGHGNDGEYDRNDDDDGSISPEGSGDELANVSGQLAVKLDQIVIQLKTISAEDIWDLFINRKVSGGYIARSVFIAGKLLEPKECAPWTGGAKLERAVRALADQKCLFLVWATTARVLDWIRLHIYITVREKPRTFKFLKVEHSGVAVNVDGMVATQASIQATDDTMARIGHLACDGDARLLLNMLFGKKTREGVDEHDLQPAALWQQLADNFINNDDWDIQTISVLQVRSIDVTKAPQPGVVSEIVQSVFSELKSDFTKLSNAVFGKTGTNSAGEVMYAEVWDNYINGKYLNFRYPNVTQYVFKLWCTHKAVGELPKYCTKDILPSAQVRMGVGHSEQMSMMTTPRRHPKGGGSTPSSSSSVMLKSPTGEQPQSLMMERATAWFAAEEARQEAVSAQAKALEKEVSCAAPAGHCCCCHTAAAAAAVVLLLLLLQSHPPPQIAKLASVLGSAEPALSVWADKIYAALGISTLEDFAGLYEDDIKCVNIPRFQLNKLMQLARDNGLRTQEK